MTEEATTSTAKKNRVSEHILKAVLKAVRETPGIRSDALADELSLHQSTVSVATLMLEERGLITRVRKGHYRYYPAGAQDVTVEPITATDIEVEALKAEVEDLRREVEELRAFKARAIKMHPDVVEDPLLLRAREICAGEARRIDNYQLANATIAGEADDSLHVLSVLAALRDTAKQVGD